MREGLVRELGLLSKHAGADKKKLARVAPSVDRLLRVPAGTSDDNRDALVALDAALERLAQRHAVLPSGRGGSGPAPDGAEWSQIIRNELGLPGGRASKGTGSHPNQRGATLDQRRKGFVIPEKVSFYFRCSSATSSRFRTRVVPAAYGVLADRLLSDAYGPSFGMPKITAAPATGAHVLLVSSTPHSQRSADYFEFAQLLGLDVRMPSSRSLAGMAAEIKDVNAIALLWEDPRPNDVNAERQFTEFVTVARSSEKPVVLIDAGTDSVMPQTIGDLVASPISDRGAMSRPHTISIPVARAFTKLADDFAGEVSSYRRTSVNIQATVSDSRLQIDTELEMLGLRDGLTDIQHTLHFDYAFYRLALADGTTQPLVVVGRDRARTITQLDGNWWGDRYSFLVGIDPPLKAGETTRYGWKTPWLEFKVPPSNETSVSSEARATFMPTGIEQHWFVTHRTELLSISLDLDADLGAHNFEALSFASRRPVPASWDREETERIGAGITTREPPNRRAATLTIHRPMIGNLYRLQCELGTLGTNGSAFPR